MEERVGGINWKLYQQNNVKILGVVLSPSTILEEMFVNWESKMDSIEKAIRSWTMRNLSVVGKIQIVKSFGIKIFIHRFNSRFATSIYESY